MVASDLRLQLDCVASVFVVCHFRLAIYHLFGDSSPIRKHLSLGGVASVIVVSHFCLAIYHL